MSSRFWFWVWYAGSLLIVLAFISWLGYDYTKTHNPIALIGISLLTFCWLNILVGGWPWSKVR